MSEDETTRDEDSAVSESAATPTDGAAVEGQASGEAVAAEQAEGQAAAEGAEGQAAAESAEGQAAAEEEHGQADPRQAQVEAASSEEAQGQADSQRAQGEAVASEGADDQAGSQASASGQQDDDDEDYEEEEPQPRVKPEVPGMHLEVDIVPEGADPFGKERSDDPYAVDPYATEDEADEQQATDEEESDAEPISSAAIDLARGARYIATGKRKTAIARVILKPGSGGYVINGRSLEQHVPRLTLQRNVRQPLETVGYQERMDVIARVHGGGVSAQAGALRHGIAKALIDADPNLRSELKRRGFLTRDARVKERKKAGLKKARKRPQFSKR